MNQTRSRLKKAKIERCLVKFLLVFSYLLFDLTAMIVRWRGSLGTVVL